MSDLVEFLNARLDEDAAGEQTWVDVCGPNFNIEKVPGNVVPPSPRMLAEVESKRRILDQAVEMTTEGDEQVCDTYETGPYGRIILKLLALPYAGHPDYQQEWKL